MDLVLQAYNKNDVREGDVYSWNNSEGDVLAEVKLSKDFGLEIKRLKANLWKRSYETIENDYLSDFDAILVYREGRGEPVSSVLPTKRCENCKPDHDYLQCLNCKDYNLYQTRATH